MAVESVASWSHTGPTEPYSWGNCPRIGHFSRFFQLIMKHILRVENHFSQEETKTFLRESFQFWQKNKNKKNEANQQNKCFLPEQVLLGDKTHWVLLPRLYGASLLLSLQSAVFSREYGGTTEPSHTGDVHCPFPIYFFQLKTIPALFWYPALRKVTLLQGCTDKCLSTGSSAGESLWVAFANSCGVNMLIMANFRPPLPGH